MRYEGRECEHTRLAVSDADISPLLPGDAANCGRTSLNPNVLERVRRQQREAATKSRSSKTRGASGSRRFSITDPGLGKIMYVDDLVTTASARSEGLGADYAIGL